MHYADDVTRESVRAVLGGRNYASAADAASDGSERRAPALPPCLRSGRLRMSGGPSLMRM